MPGPRILLLGRDGQVGRALQPRLATLGQLVALDRTGLPGLPADFSRPMMLAPLVQYVAPQIIVNAAAYTAVDRAETEPAMAHAVNAQAVGVLAQQATLLGAWLLHFSSDYVFDGTGSIAWREESPTDPLNTYGQSKLAGEQMLRTACAHHLILRTSWIHSGHADNFVRRLLDAALAGRPLRVVADQVGAPTEASLLSDVAVQLLRAVAHEPALAGTYHVASAGAASRYEVACAVVQHARRCGLALPRAKSRVEAIDSATLQSAAARPANSRLDTARLRRILGVELPDWPEGIERSVREQLAGQRAA